jgi:rhodanese-related sulfurtransferase
LLDLGLPNPVFALRDGTQGWEIAGFTREQGANRPFAPDFSADDSAQALALAQLRREGVPCIDLPTLHAWRADTARTTYLFDPRPQGAAQPGFVPAPGTTLIQQTDQFIAVKGARVVLWDAQLPRAAFAAIWLHRMGIEVAVLEGDPDGLAAPARPSIDMPAHIAAQDLAHHLASGAQVIDLRPYSAFAAQRLQGARRVLRPMLPAVPLGAPIVLVSDAPSKAALAASDLALMGHTVLGYSAPSDWANADLPFDTAAPPPDDRIDEVRFCGGRHAGSLEDARAYLAWETGLLAQLDAAGLAPWPPIRHDTPSKENNQWLPS